MNYRNRVWVLLLILLISCHNGKGKKETEFTVYANTQQLIEAPALNKILKNENIVVVDFRTPEEYAKAHIEGALNVWRPQIEDATFPYNGMMAKRGQIEKLLRDLGIENRDTIVIYDNRGMPDAARLWWVLKNYNFESVKLLNGGFGSWQRMGGAISSKLEVATPSEFVLQSAPSKDLVIDKEELLDLISKKGRKMVLIDARTYDEYSGKRKKEGADKAGHIPRSIHIDWSEAIAYNTTKKFKNFTELKQLYLKKGVLETDSIVVYCHSGSRSAHTLFVLTELLGYNSVRNYDGSWLEWSNFDELPVEKDGIVMLNK